MSNLEVQGGSFAFTGKIKGYTKASLSKHIQSMGGSVFPSASSGLTAYLVGDRASDKKVDKARALGLTIVSDDALYAFLEDGKLSLDALNPTRPVNELIAEARSLLAMVPAHETWKQLAALVDECSEEQMEAFLAYLAPNLEQWADVSALSPLSRLHSGLFDNTADTVCFVPDVWMGELIGGEQHPKHALCKSLTFSYMAVNNTNAIKLLDNPSLKTLTTFDVGTTLAQNMKKKTFYKALASCENLDSVDTLVLAKAPAGSFAELLKATSMPNLKALYLNSDTLYMSDANQGVDVMFGPWAEQLERVMIRSDKQLEALADRIGELPALHSLLIGCHPRTEAELFTNMATQLPRVVPHIKSLVIGINSYDSYAKQTGIGDLLDAIDGPLETLDLSWCSPFALQGEAGVVFVQKHFIDNGLVGRVSTLVVNELVDAAVVSLLREQGLEVISPLNADASDDSASELVVIEEVAPGEDERRAANEVHVHDAMMFPYPCKAAWNTLTGVVDALELQLESDAFEQAIQTLESYLEPWPDSVRICPERWYAAYMSDSPSPKVRLSRAFSYDGPFYYQKEYAAWVTEFARSEACSYLTHISSYYEGKQKFFTRALSALFDAVKPTSYSVRGTHALSALESENLLPDTNVTYTLPEENYSQDMDTLSQRRVLIQIETPEQFESLINHTELDHVVSLDLNLSPSEDGADWPEVKGKVGKFRNLRHLRIQVSNYSPAHYHAALATWLSNARPVYINDDFSWSSPFKTPAVLMAQKGLYSRTYGSHVVLPATMGADELGPLLSDENFNVAGLSIMYGDCSCPDTTDLVEMMHDGLKRSLQYLKWPVAQSDLDNLNAIFEALPGLTLWGPLSPDFKKQEGRVPLFTALAQAPATAQICQLRVVGMYGSDSEKYSSAETKILKKGKGAKPYTLMPNNL